MDEIKISVIMPIYNVERYLAKCIESVLASTLKDIEILAVNDGSKDNSVEIVESFAAKDKRIKLINKENGGYGSAVNTGIDNAVGKYISIVETDDWVASDMFEKLHTKAEETNADVTKGRYFMCLSEEINNKVEFDKRLPINKILTIEECPEILIFAPSIWSAIYRKEYLYSKNIRFTEKVRPYEDLPFAWEVYSRGSKFILVDELVYFYRSELNQNSSTCRNDEKLFKVIEQIKRGIKIVQDNGTWEILKEAILLHIYNVMLLFVKNVRKDLKPKLFKEFSDVFKSAAGKEINYKYFDKYVVGCARYLYKNNRTLFKFYMVKRFILRHPLFFFRKDFWRKLNDY